MTISGRLIALIASAISTILLLGGFGLYQFDKIHEETDHTSGATIPAIVASGKLALAVKEIEPVLMALYEEQDEDLIDAFNDKLKKAIVTARTRFQALDALSHDDRQRQLIKDLNGQLEKYERAVANAMTLSASLKTKADAQLVMYSQVLPTRDAVNRSLDLLLKEADTAEANSRDRIEHLLHRATFTYSVLIVVSLLALAAGGWFLYQSIARPLRGMADTVRGIASSLDFTARAPVTHQDEIGETIQAFNELLDVVQISFKDMIAAIHSVVIASIEMHQSAIVMAHTATSGNQAAANMSASIGRVAEGISDVASRTQDAARRSHEAGDVAVEGSETIHTSVNEILAVSAVAHRAEDNMNALDHAASKIGGMVSVIREVADQTNLLALNAAIEAARAGEAGRGFAVVADEVRRLAERTRQTTHDIAEVVSTILDASRLSVGEVRSMVIQLTQGADHAREVSVAIDKIQEGATQVENMVSEISSTMISQDDNANAMAQEVSNIMAMMNATEISAKRTAEFADDMRKLAETMNTIVSRFNVGEVARETGAADGTGDVELF
ncbi:methyl-accepting chemotaxis protein [Burkholderiaceae bacterium DAT-1]|nr:methyl-accepting chemotaxis protein [Burkholderiaceae bacterium DAT-1]